jgi:hypothetical protein
MTLLPHSDKVISNDTDVRNFANLFRDFKIEYIEQSVKITHGAVSRDRAMFAYHSDKVKFSKIKSLLEDLKFPKNCLYEAEQQYYKSHGIGVAIEKSNGKLNYRIYFESVLPQSKWIELTNNLHHTFQSIHSYKWDYDTGDINSSAYNTVLEPSGQLALLEIQGTGTTFVPDCVTNKLKAYGTKKHTLGVFLVTDTATSRQAVDMNFGLDVLYNRDLSQDLHKFSKKNLENILTPYDEKPIHHVSIGMGKNNEPYVTLYYLIHDPERGI